MTAASDELALPTVGEFLSAVGVTATVVHPEHPGSPVVALDIPYDWHEVIREVLPTAFGAWALPAAAGAPPQEAGWVDNAVLMVWRMSRPVDPMAVMRCAFTDSRRLPDWHEHRTRSEDRDDFPSAAISGTYSFGELSLWASTRYLMAGTPTGQYLVQLTVTTRAEDDRDGRFIAGSLEVHSPAMQPASQARPPEPPVADAWPESDVNARSDVDLRSELPLLATESTGAHAWSEAMNPPRSAAVAWSESAADTRSGSSASAVRSPAELPGPATEPTGAHAWSVSSDSDAQLEFAAEMRSEPSIADPRPKSLDLAFETAGAHAWSESAAGMRSELSSAAGRSLAELPDAATESAGAHAWVESPGLGVRSEPAGGGGRSAPLAAVVQAEFFDEGGASASGQWLEPTGLTGQSGSAGLTWSATDLAGHSAAGLRSESPDAAFETAGAHVWVESPDLGVRSETAGGPGHSGTFAAAVHADLFDEGGAPAQAPASTSGVRLEPTGLTGRSGSAGLGWSESDLVGHSAAGVRSESPDVAFGSAGAHAWVESPGLGVRDEFGGGRGRFDSLAADVPGEGRSGAQAWSEAEAAEAWLESRGLARMSRGGAAGRVEASEVVGQVEPAVVAWSEVPETVGRVEPAVLAWSEAPELGGEAAVRSGVVWPEAAAAGESAERVDGGWPGEPDGEWGGVRGRGLVGGREWVGQGDGEWVGDRVDERVAGRGREWAGEADGAWAEERGRERPGGREWVGQGDGEWGEDADGEWFKDADGEWVEGADGEWGEDAEEEWDEDSDGEWEELEEAEEVPWSEAPSVVVRAESVAGGAQSEPSPVVRDALLPVLGETVPEVQGEPGQSGNVGFRI